MVDNRNGSMFLCGTWTGIEKKFLDGSMKKINEVIGELVGFVLWEEFFVIDEVAGKKLKFVVSETNVDGLDLFVLGCHDECLVLVEEVCICS